MASGSLHSEAGFTGERRGCGWEGWLSLMCGVAVKS